MITCEINIVCDVCDARYEAESHMPTTEAVNKGWVVTNMRDLCPVCAEKEPYDNHRTNPNTNTGNCD
jgi:hypothetical protein